MGSSGVRREQLLLQRTITSGENPVDINLSAYQGFTDLRLRGKWRNTVADASVFMRLSTDGTTFDTSGNYDQQFLYGTAATPSALESLGATQMTVGRAMNTASQRGESEIVLFSYKDATAVERSVGVHYQFKASTSSGGLQLLFLAEYWRNTNPILGVRFFLNSGNFDTGSSVSVYGIP